MPFVQPLLRLSSLIYGGPTPTEYRIWFEELYNPQSYLDKLEDAWNSCKQGCKESAAGCKSLCCDCKKQQPTGPIQKGEGLTSPRVLPPRKLLPASELSREKVEALGSAELEAALNKVDAPPKVEIKKLLTHTLEIQHWKHENLKTKFCLGTWLRQEGHKIDFGGEHWGSRILARFQMMRRTTEEEKALYVVWRRRQPARPRWWPESEEGSDNAAVASTINSDPESYYFPRAGEVFMVIQSLRDNRFYAIVIPSFDLRFPSENGFFVLNTLTQCFLNIEEVSTAQQLEEFEKQLKTAKKKEQIAEIENQKFTFLEQMKNLRSRESFSIGADVDLVSAQCLTERGTKDFQCHLGYDASVTVTKGDFICRLMKLGGGVADRAQSVFWFDVMQIVPPLNLMKDMTISEERLPLCTVKGAFRINRVPEAAAREQHAAATVSTLASAGPRYEQPIISEAPTGHHWQVEALKADIYVLTARGLDNVDIIGKSDPYIVAGKEPVLFCWTKELFTSQISCNGHEERSDIVWENDLNPDFYERFSIPFYVPGNAMLKINVMDRGEGLASDALIGAAYVDLEERWFALKHLEMSKSEKRDAFVRSDPASGQEVGWLPPTSPPPIEIMPLTRGNEIEGGIATGTIRYFIHIQPEQEQSRPLPIETLRVREEFELRLIIWNVFEISVFKDSGQRNDLFVECALRFLDSKYQEQRYVFRTDVHEYANTEAYFNWRIVVPLQLPLLAAEAKFTLLDADPTLPPRPVYAPEKRPLDDFFRTQLDRLRSGDPLLPTIDYEIEFSDPMYDSIATQCFRETCCHPLEPLGCPQKCTRVGCGACLAPEQMGDTENGVMAPDLCACCLTSKQRRRRELQKKVPVRPAKLKCSIEVIPKSAAEKNPVGSERKGPNALPEPPHRFQRGMMWRDPIGFLRIILGPAVCAAIQIGTIIGGALLGLLFVTFIVSIIVIAVKV